MDTDLVVRARDGDEIAFARLADGVYGRLQQLAFRILRDPDLARDAAQQTALSMRRNLPQLRDPVDASRPGATGSVSTPATPRRAS